MEEEQCICCDEETPKEKLVCPDCEDKVHKTISKKKTTAGDAKGWIALTSLLLVVAIGSYIFGYWLGSKSVEPVSTPETEVIVDDSIDESTPAPDNLVDIPSVPDQEENIPDEEAEPEPVEPVIEIDPYELEMLACVIYQEAGGSSHCDDCRRRVADVVLNRVEHPDFPDTMYEVLTAKSQYGRFYWTGIVWPERAKYDVEKDAVARAYRIAEEVLMGQHSSLYGQGYIWQAEFVQGSSGFWCCGHYFGR